MNAPDLRARPGREASGSGAAVIRLAVSVGLGAIVGLLVGDGTVSLVAWPLWAGLALLVIASWRGGSEPPGSLVALQVGFDLLVITTLVACTGGTGSPLVLLFTVPVLLGASLRGARGASASALGAAAAFSILAAWVGGPDGRLDTRELASAVAVHALAFALLATLSGTLAERGSRHRREAAAASAELHRVRISTDRILEHMPIGILTASLEGRIVRVNRGAREMLGLSASEILTGTDLAALLAEIAPSLVEAMESVLLTRKWAVREEVVLHRGDQEHPIGVSFAPLVEENETLEGIIVTLSDLRQVRRMEHEMYRSSQLANLGELAAGVAHEIRNPLASISGAIQMLEAEDGRSEEERELMELVVNEADRLNRIIEGVLDYTRDHSGSRHVHDVSQTASEVIRLLRHDKLAVGKTLLLDFPANQSFRARAEENGIKQVFLNLARNALQAMEVGGILRVSGQVQNGRIYVVFRDTGTGIAPHEMESLFKPFHTSKRGGTGLGLSIAARIVEGNGGALQVKSTPGMGSAFTVELPAESAAERADERSTDGADRPMTGTGNPHPASRNVSGTTAGAT